VRSAGERGQATVELVLVLPLLAGVALALLQVALVARDQLAVVAAAREGARAAAVDPDPVAAEAGALGAVDLRPSRVRVEVRGRGEPGEPVVVVVAYASPTEVPIFGALVGDVHLRARAVMRVEA